MHAAPDAPDASDASDAGTDGASPSVDVSERLEDLRRARFAAECLLFVGATQAAASSLADVRRIASTLIDDVALDDDRTRLRAPFESDDTPPAAIVDTSFRLEARVAARDPGARRRRGLAALGVAVALLVAGLAAAADRPPVARASAVWGASREVDGSKAVDGDSRTEWLLPDRLTGTLDIALRPARDVHRVLLLNGHNSPHSDRATAAARVELYRGSRRLAQADVVLAPFDIWPLYVPVSVRAPRVDRVRIVVLRTLLSGAALAEVVIR